MEDLNKNQLILLALLVSFVTSIATGIATVSLLEQAPKEVTRVINRVVERTVETITPQTNVITKEETVVVREEDLITESIQKLESRLARIFDSQGTFLALGVVAFGEDGTIMTTPTAAQGAKQVEVAGLGTFNAQSIGSGDARVGLIRITDDLASTPLDSLMFTTAGDLKLGQSIIALSGSTQTNVAIGVISQLRVEPDDSGVPAVVSLNTNIAHENLLPGSVVANLFGETVALFDGQSYLSLTVLKKALAGRILEN